MKRLKDFVEGRFDLLTIRTTEAYLTRSPVKTLEVFLDEDSEILTSSREREVHFTENSPGWYNLRLNKWRQGEVDKIRIATIQHPLEVVTGDICLILVIEGKEYALSVFREVGWLLPGGCPKNLEEVFYPSLTAQREIAEEILIGDTEGRIYILSCLEETLDQVIETAHKWKLEPEDRSIVTLPYEEVFPEKGDATSLIMKIGRASCRERV